MIGGLRVTHLVFVGTDPVLLRFAGLHLTPSDRTVVAWLKAFTPQMLEKLSELIRELVYDQVERCGLSRLTIDRDGTVLRTGTKVDGAERGFNPHHLKDLSYYPPTAHLTQHGQILRVWNRPGNVHDSHNAAGFLGGVFEDLRGRFGHRLPVELRMDAAFFHPEIFSFLDGERVEYALKAPMWKWLGLRSKATPAEVYRRRKLAGTRQSPQVPAALPCRCQSACAIRKATGNSRHGTGAPSSVG
ncbi:MAG: hypothetical protein GY937_22220 [bacterium]|nr:hypothetical protein [bacterium]